MRDLPAKFFNLSRTYLQTLKIYQGSTYKVFEFIKNLPTKLLNLCGTCLQIFSI